MSQQSKNFLQQWMDAYKNWNPGGANDNFANSIQKSVDDAAKKRALDPTRNATDERGDLRVGPLESLLTPIKQKDLNKAEDKLIVKTLGKTQAGIDAENLGIEILPSMNESGLQRSVDTKRTRSSLDALNKGLPEDQRAAIPEGASLETLEALLPGIRELSTANTTERSAVGKRNRESHEKGLEATEQTIAASKAATELNSVIAQNDQINQLNADDWNKYVYGDGKREAQIERDWQASRDDAKFDANLATIKLQNAAEMERYEMMLQNDKEVRQSESISDLMAALSMLGGAFML